MEMAGDKTVTRSWKQEGITDFEANLLAAWRELEQLYREAQRLVQHGQKKKHRDSELWSKLSLETFDNGSSIRIKVKGISGSPTLAERKRKFSDGDTTSVNFSSFSEEEEGEEVFQPATMSLEDSLTYDQPQKKKKVDKPSLSAGEEDQWHSPWVLCHPSPNSSCDTLQSPSHHRTNEKRAAQEPPEAPQPKRILLEDNINLPDIPLPCFQASCSPLPTVEDIISSQNITGAMASTAEETEEGFIGRRLYSKTPVFSGSKTAPRVPKTMAPAPQSVQDLKYNSGGQVPKTIPLVTPHMAPPANEDKCSDGPTTSKGRPVPSLGRTMFSNWFPEPKKPTGKKTAPLMAKSMRDYKKKLLGR